MLVQLWRNHKTSLLMAVVAGALATGWAARERALAEEKAQFLKSQTLTPGDVKSVEATWEGKPTGQLALYYQGNTAGTKNFASGRFILNPGAEPHPIHQHPEEEILIVASGQGEIICD